MNILNYFYRIGNKIVRHTSWYNDEYWQGVTKFWNLQQFGLDLVNLGSGAGVYAFDYEGCDIKASNWALSPQSLVHDYNILKNYFSYLHDGAVVIITVCPFSCLYSKYGKKLNLKYYTILHPATIIDFEESERTKALLFKKDPFKQAPIFCIKKTIYEAIRILKSLIVKSNINIQKSADGMIMGWKHQFGLINLDAPMSNIHKEQFESRRKTLSTIVDFCKERDLKPVIVIPPMHHTLWHQFPKEFLSNYVESFINSVDAPIYDYMKSKDFDKEEYFKTALFLNKRGAKMFTARVLEDLGMV